MTPRVTPQSSLSFLCASSESVLLLRQPACLIGLTLSSPFHYSGIALKYGPSTSTHALVDALTSTSSMG